MTKTTYVALVSKATEERSRAGDVFHIRLQNPLPVLPIPLYSGELVPLELQTAFVTVYEDGLYRLYLDYSPPRTPRLLSSEEREWLDTLLRQEGLRE